MKPLVHRVYEGFIEGERLVFSVNAVREISLREEVRANKKQLKFGRLIFETENRNKALDYTKQINGLEAEF